MSKQHKRLPHEIDPFRLCESGAELEGNIPLKQFKRLKPLLIEGSDDSGQVNIVLNFDIDELGVPFVSGRIKTKLALICQRCLGTYEYPVDQEINLAWAKSEQEMKDLPLRIEPYLVETNPLATNDVIEDELLLAIPQIPMHDKDKCSASNWVDKEPEQNTDDTTEKENPFAVLSKMKTKD